MAEQAQGRKISILRLVFEALIVAATFIALTVFVMLLMLFVLEGTGPGQIDLVNDPEAFTAVQIATLFGAPLVLFGTLVVGDMLLRKRQVSLRSLGFKRPDNIGVTIFEGLGLTVILLVMWVAIWQFYDAMGLGVPFEFFTIVRGDDFRFFYAMTLVAWVAAAFGEEVLFRGFFLNNFIEMFKGSKAGIVFAVILQAMLFSLLHKSGTLVQSVPVFLTGALLGGAYFLFNRNLWPLIIAHGLLNNLYFALLHNETIG